jgi:hypothetical protein
MNTRLLLTITVVSFAAAAAVLASVDPDRLQGTLYGDDAIGPEEGGNTHLSTGRGAGPCVCQCLKGGEKLCINQRQKPIDKCDTLADVGIMTAKDCKAALGESCGGFDENGDLLYGELVNCVIAPEPKQHAVDEQPDGL